MNLLFGSVLRPDPDPDRLGRHHTFPADAPVSSIARELGRQIAVLITSRSAAEYAAMFDLTPADLTDVSVLDCCAGGSSLAAETNAHVLAVDPAYGLGCENLAGRVWAALRDGDRIIDAHADRFEWDWYGDPAHRTRQRTTAAHRFLADFQEHPERYVAGALPHLPLADASFDITLCSHLLFTWSNEFDVDWHRSALAELIRVTRRQVRIFPLVVQGTGQPVPFLDNLRAELDAAGHRTHMSTVPYRFQRGANQMLLIETTDSGGPPL